MAGLLKAFLAERAGRAWAPGRNDCALFIADWVLEQTGIDPVAWARGTYRSIDEGLAKCAQPGLVRAVGRALRRAGLGLIRTPAVGDVAMVVFAGRACCAIRTERRFALYDEAGLNLVPAIAVRVIAAWRV